MKNRNLVKMNGFTLIELLIVMGIIAVLSGIGIFALNNTRQGARDAKRKSDLEQIRSALELYKSDCNSYPAAVPAVGAALTSNCTGSLVTYMQKWPGDPSGGGRTYLYQPSAAPVTSYTFCAALEVAVASASCVGSCGSVACNYGVTNP